MAMTVLLYRVPRACRVCGAPRTPYTHPGVGTRVRASCSPYRCRVARVFALATGPRPAGWEPLPVDDRDQVAAARRNLLGAGGAA